MADESHILIQTDDGGLKFIFHDENGDVEESHYAQDMEGSQYDKNPGDLKDEFEQAHNMPVKLGVIERCENCYAYSHVEEGINIGPGGLCSVCRADRIQDETLLSSQQSYAYVLNSQDGYTESEISDIMNLEPGTVRSHLQRGRNKLKQAERTVDLLS